MHTCKTTRRRFLEKAVLTASAMPLLGSRIARAQTWPTRPVRVLVPFGPGGSADVAARFVRHRLAVVADFAGVGGKHAERDPHGRGLAGAVAADEPEQLARTHAERHVLQRHRVAVPLADVVNLEHAATLAAGASPFDDDVPS